MLTSVRDFIKMGVVAFGIVALADRGSAKNYYVDYSGGSDAADGLNTGSAWQHCPGDVAASGQPAKAQLQPGDNVFFKGGVRYVFTGKSGIQANWNGAPNNPITYDGNSSGAWGTGRAVFTDNGGTQVIVAFNAAAALSQNMSYLVFNSLEIGPLGGGFALPPDPGGAVPPSAGVGIGAGRSMNNVVIENCYFHAIGYWQNQKPMGMNSISGQGVLCYGSSSLTITNCEFTKMQVPAEMQGTYNITNLVIANCRFHDYVVWCIDLPVAVNGVRNGIYIHDNQFYDTDWAYVDAYWTGYQNGPHQDTIFNRADHVLDPNAGGNPINTFTDINLCIYNNAFWNNHPYGGGTSCIWFLDTPGAYIYNNTFNSLHPANSTVSITAAAGRPAAFYFYNNTFLQYGIQAVGWGGNSGSDTSHTVWPTNAYIYDANNIYYDAKPSSGVSALSESATNGPIVQLWALDYDDFYAFGNAVKVFINQSFTFQNMQVNWPTAPGGGFELHGMFADPQFQNISYAGATNAYLNNLSLRPTSPAVSGANLTGLNLPGLNSDILGIPRPATGPWTMGAYELTNGTVVVGSGPPPPKVKGVHFLTR